MNEEKIYIILDGEPVQVTLGKPFISDGVLKIPLRLPGVVRQANITGTVCYGNEKDACKELETQEQQP